MAPAEHALRAALDRVRRRWFTLVALSVASRIGAALAVVLALAALLDRSVRLSGGEVLAVCAAGLAVAMGVAAAVAWPYRRRPDDGRVARFVEERCPELDDAVAAAVDVCARPAAPAFAPLVIEAAVVRLRAVDVRRVIAPEAIRAGWTRAAAALLAAGLAAVLAMPVASRALAILRVRFFPATFSVQVRPGDARVVAGRPFRIAAVLDQRGRALTGVVPEVQLESKGEVRTVAMTAQGNGYELRIDAVDRSFGYRVRAGRAVSSTYHVTALIAPRIEAVDLHYDYPGFTHLAPRDERDGGDIYAPAGTHVRVRVRADRPVTAAQVALADSSRLPAARVDARTFESTVTLSADGSYRATVMDGDGLSAESVEYFIRLVADRPADIHIVRPSGDQEITALEEVPVEARADDDYGIAGMDLVFSVAGGPERVIPFTNVSGTGTARVGTRLLAAEELGVKAGDVIAYYARARDVPHAKASTLSRSEIFFLEVKPFDEAYSLADSQAMAAATGTELAGLIAAQKEVISATWNLERRASAGSSSADVKAVADAQAEVKARTERAAGAARPRRRGFERMFFQFGAQPPEGAGSPDAVGRAAVAMGRAVERLHAGATKDAISPEMAALNALLKAEADIRQRQVTQQRSGSTSFGNGRQGQDLSTLFDRELKRQQRTNYETGSQAEQQTRQTGDQAALDRIRDLARRQEDLAAQQKALDGSQAADAERRRQLETLTREQEQLRRELEDAVRQGQAGQSAARDALEQMRRAASELQRSDAGAAAARSADAARQLRRAQDQMQAGAPDARQRALGDLQLEAREIADAQRQLASEAARLDRDGGAGSDARRRLGGEQDQLADRLQRLGQNATRAGAQAVRGSSPAADEAARSAAAQGARAIESQQLTDRMRRSANALRDGGRAAPTGELADALDQVARTFGGADAGGARGESQKLADTLDQVRDARDRLARLEKQMGDLQQQQARAAGSRSRSAGSTRSGNEGRGGAGAPGGGEQGGAELARAQQEYAREVQRTRDLMERLQGGSPDSADGTATPEGHEWSWGAPGTEAWKQDFGRWQSLGRDVGRALERYEGSVAGRLSKSLAHDRLAGGGSERVPDAYAQRVAKYYELLAKVKRQ